MKGQLRHQAWILLAGSLIVLTHLGGTRLWDKDETIYGSCAREMFTRGDWVVPTFNGHLFPDKPPLMYWLMMTGYHVFGVTEWGARFWSAVLALLTALVTYHLGRLLFRAEVGLWAGLIVVSNIIFAVSARAATVDSALTFTATLALLLFVLATGIRGSGAAAGSRSTDGGAATLVTQPGPWWLWGLFYGALGLGMLAKGPVGIVLPVASLGLLLLITGRPDDIGSDSRPASASRGARLLTAVRGTFGPRSIGRALWSLRPLTGIAVVLAVTAPWFILVGLRTHGAWLEQFFLEQNLNRALAAFDNHRGPIFYYVPAILVGFFPWSVFFVPTLSAAVRRARRDDPQRAGYLLMLCWLGVYVVFWSLVRTKLPHYVLPVYPALALLTATFLVGWLDRPEQVHRGWMLNATITWMVVGVTLLVAVPVVASFFLPGEGAIGLVGLILIVGGAACLLFAQRGQTRRMMRGFAVTAVVFITAVFGFAARRVDRHQNAAALLAEVRRLSPDPLELAAYRFFRESFVFYSGQRIPHFGGTDALRNFLARSRRPFVLTTDRYERELLAAFPGQLRAVARQPRFLKCGEQLVVLQRCPGPGGDRTAHQPAGGGAREAIRVSRRRLIAPCAHLSLTPPSH